MGIIDQPCWQKPTVRVQILFLVLSDVCHTPVKGSNFSRLSIKIFFSEPSTVRTEWPFVINEGGRKHIMPFPSGRTGGWGGFLDWFPGPNFTLGAYPWSRECGTVFINSHKAVILHTHHYSFHSSDYGDRAWSCWIICQSTTEMNVWQGLKCPARLK